ncbi:Uncharacterized membrane protein [Rhizobium sp. RU20A]|uniref:DUF2254 domain-containing protein n=1 Tax=Rhizobium sp. RU20A TaxID=1907412 RepID=UPI0009568D87|nr:DUF2254 domain-containing protein [Rhizobium sp. RU20A]SIR17076.1 Uncharacterized membrane protein [Rhizobium sp. RU20A]
MNHWVWLFGKIARRLWFRASLYCIAGMSAALAAILLGPYIPASLTTKLGADAVGSILTIIASSMLAVTTFSLSTLVSATASAAGSATPRATTLMLEDETAQRALATFLGAFLFALVGLITLHTGAYGDGGRLVLFAATLVMIALVVLTLLRWIDYLARLGRMGETIARVEAVAEREIDAYCEAPLIGCRLLTTVPAEAVFVEPEKPGYVQRIDFATLQSLAETMDGRIFILRRPGGLTGPGLPLLAVANESRGLFDEQAEALRKAFVVDRQRDFAQDPRFGLVVLAEIGIRAHSPAVNDPGTAIDVANAQLRLHVRLAEGELKALTEAKASDQPGDGEASGDGALTVTYDRLHLPPITPADVFDDSFLGMAREGAGALEFAVRLQKIFHVLMHVGHKPTRVAARSMADDAAERSLSALSFEPDRVRFLAARKALGLKTDTL